VLARRGRKFEPSFASVVFSVQRTDWSCDVIRLTDGTWEGIAKLFLRFPPSILGNFAIPSGFPPTIVGIVGKTVRLDFSDSIPDTRLTYFRHVSSLVALNYDTFVIRSSSTIHVFRARRARPFLDAAWRHARGTPISDHEKHGERLFWWR
jgi:hypothetical protein